MAPQGTSAARPRLRSARRTSRSRKAILIALSRSPSHRSRARPPTCSAACWPMASPSSSADASSSSTMPPRPARSGRPRVAQPTRDVSPCCTAPPSPSTVLPLTDMQAGYRTNRSSRSVRPSRTSRSSWRARTRPSIPRLISAPRQIHAGRPRQRPPRPPRSRPRDDRVRAHGQRRIQPGAVPGPCRRSRRWRMRGSSTLPRSLSTAATSGLRIRPCSRAPAIRRSPPLRP